MIIKPAAGTAHNAASVRQGDSDRCRSQDREDRQRREGMNTRNNKHCRCQQICGQRAGRNLVGLSRFAGRSVKQAGHDQGRHQDETAYDVEECAPSSSTRGYATPGKVQSVPRITAVIASHRQRRSRASASAAAVTMAR